ncbi:MAG: SDR family oxidoreductase [Gammaproteobacteria bacterium]|nr:SDR family oxidoreductase [Gammaproteobacteria bacterium]
MTNIALVTGAGSGIGKACALALAEAGHHVVLTGRTASSLETTQKEAAAGSTSVCACDVSDPASVDALFDFIRDQHGRLDVVFNNAGNNVAPKVFGDLTYDEWQTVINVNLNGAFLIANRAFHMMQRQEPQGGRIINNGSISAYVPRPGSAPYTASKHAITGLTRTISLDGRPFNIACGQIDIGNAASDMTARMNSGVPQADGSIKSEPTMDVQNVANAVVHMAGLSLDANVQFMTIMSTTMPFIGRG